MSDSENVRDLFDFVAPSENQLSNISNWASKALELQAEIEVVEAHLKHLNKELTQIVEGDLPSAMMAAGSSEFTMTDGSRIKIDDVIQGSLSKDEEKREFTLDWVVDEGGEDIIKEHFEIDYTKTQYAAAMAFRQILVDHKVHFDEFESIHHSTLKSFLNEKLRQGTMPPFDKMGLRYFKKATIKK